MISNELRTKYRPTIGVECHVQLKTRTKLFAAVGNDARNAEPNTLVSHICMGLPGALPVLNERAVELASRAAFALGTKPQHFSKFDRKHYFYPDLPNGYQITQFDEPIILGGSVEYEVNGTIKRTRITRAHLEADAGKNTHPYGADYSLVDLNRAGTPLLEIVSEPDLHSAAETRAYAHELFLLMKYAGVSDCDLFQGNMRFDVNVSVSKTKDLGTRTETKNLNSFKSVERAVEYEIERQIELLEKGEVVVQETRGWDDAKQKTISQRSKEEAHDYRYFPDPDLPPVKLSKEYIATIKASMADLPNDWREKLAPLELDQSHIDILLEAEVADETVTYLAWIEQVMTTPQRARQLANWMVNVELPLRNEHPEQVVLKDSERNKLYAVVSELVSENKLSSTNAKAVLTDLLQQASLPKDVEDYATQKNYIQVSDEAAITKIVAAVIKENPNAVADIKKGEQKAIGFLVGQVMKSSQGKANPAMAQKLIRQQLEI